MRIRIAFSAQWRDFTRKGGGPRQSYEDLEEPVSLLVRLVQTIYNNETFGAYTAYQFKPEWGNGPQYLFPIQVSRELDFVASHGIPQSMDSASLERLIGDIEGGSNVWKKWHNAEHIVVEVDDDSQCLVPENIFVPDSLSSSGDILVQTKRPETIIKSITYQEPSSRESLQK